MLPQWLHVLVSITILIGILLIAYTSIVEALHLNDKGWTKPKYIIALERIAIGCFVIVFIIAMIIAVIFTIIF